MTEKAKNAATSPNIIGFDMGAAEDLAAREEQGIPVEWEDVLGRTCYQPDGVTPLAVTIVGSLSKRHRKVEAIQRGRGWKSGIASNSQTEPEDDATLGERLVKEATESVAQCVIGWTPGFTDKGKEFTYTPANAIRLLALNPHMQTKLARKMHAHADFFPASSNGSSPS